MEILCVGTGRDGTTSLAHMVQTLYDYYGDGRRAGHEYCSETFSDAFCRYHETRDECALAEIRDLIAECPFACIVGNGYAVALPFFTEHYGRGLKLVHIRRADRAACIRSLRRNSELFPRAYGYYSPKGSLKRPAAFHFNEMSRDAWDLLPLEEKLGWYYDKTHALIAAGREMVDTYVEIPTEAINDAATRRTLAQLVLGGDATTLPPPTHMNRHYFDGSMLPEEQYQKAQWLLQWLDLRGLAADDVYLLRYAVDRYIEWTKKQLSGELQEASPADVRSRGEVAAALSEAETILRAGIADIVALRNGCC